MRQHRSFLAAMCLAVVTCSAPVAKADVYDVFLVGSYYAYNDQFNMDIDLRIRPGDTVRWNWVLGTHNVTSGPPGQHDGQFYSGPPDSGPTFEFTFEDAGEYPYYCEYHYGGGMMSTVVVLCPADFNNDEVVNTLDFLAFLNAFSAGDPSADFNGDEVVNTLDFLAFLNAFNTGC